MKNLRNEASNLFAYTQSLRRDFHIHPELGFQEIRTAGIVARELTSLGLKVNTGIGVTGVTALLSGSGPGPVILLRADMDALPILEENNVEYASQNKGVMHACGHDAHTAVLLTVAKMLTTHRDELHGTVKLVFQPAEEGMGGAEKMIEDDILKDPPPDFAFALHVWNEQPVGYIGIPTNAAMAGGDIFTIKIIGKGGHGAVPHLATDPVLASAQVITALQGIVSRNVSPLKTAVVSICTLHAGETFNVIPPFAEMSGTIRTFDPDVRQLVLQRFEEVVKSTAQAMGCQAEISLQVLTPATINNPDVAARVQQIARQLLPEKEVNTSDYITMGSEDFAFILEKIPGCFFFIGTSNKSLGLTSSHHHPKFDIDETALPDAAALMTGIVMSFLSSVTDD